MLHGDKSKESVTLHLSLPKDILVGLWKLAAQRKITLERYLEELLDSEAFKQIVNQTLAEAEENKRKIVKFPLVWMCVVVGKPWWVYQIHLA